MKDRAKETRKLVGHMGVDAGLCWIGDPCYIIHPHDGMPKTLGKDWDEFCDIIEKEPRPLAKSFAYSMGHEGLGVCVSTGYGDGTYPVYIEIEDGRVKSVTVEFFEDEVDEEDEEEDSEKDG